MAPSFGAFIEPYHSAFLNAVKKFEAMDYRILCGPNVFLGEGIGISNTPEKCGAELTEYYLSEDCDALMAVGGGELMCNTIDHVDFEKIKNAKPKWYMGFSDNTHFTFLLPTLCDTAAVYGPHAPTFGMEPWDESLFDAMALLNGTKTEFLDYPKWEREKVATPLEPYLPYNTTEPSTMCFRNWDGAPISGRFLGGCLDVLSNLCGTKYDRVKEFCEKYKEDGIIWFLEACDLNSVSIERALWTLRNAGWFDTAKAFIFGRPAQFGDRSLGMTTYEACMHEVERVWAHIPVVFDADLGHLPPQIPMISGGYGTMSGSHFEEPSGWTEEPSRRFELRIQFERR